MRAMITASVLVVATTAAHAGRRSTTFDPVGWSTDGKSAMFTRDVQEDEKMGRISGYVIVTATESKPLEITISDTLAEKTNEDAPPDRIDVATCNKARDTLAKVIATKKLTGLKIEPKECTGPTRTVVHAESKPGTKLPEWWIVQSSGSKVHNPPTKREAAALAAAASITQDPSVEIAASPDGNFVLVFYTGKQGEALAYFYKGALVAKDL